MGAWVIGHNLAGYLPESDTYAYETWQDAWDGFVGEIEHYADTDDDAAYACLSATADMADYPDRENSGYGDDEPSMLASVKAWLTDDSPAEGSEVTHYETDNDERLIAFWLVWSDDREPDEED
jgi:hypothetical protein